MGENGTDAAEQISPDHLETLVDHLRSPLPWGRNLAVEELASVDFDQFERPPQVSLLLAAASAPELRDRARDSLARVLRGMDQDELERIGREDRRALRAAIKASTPQLHADFLVEASKVLLRIGDTEAIGVLEDLVERSTIRQYIAVEHRPRQGIYKRIARSFEGTPEEEHEVRRVRSAAHVACERLKLVAQTGASVADLLRPALPPDDRELLRPAESAAADPELLLRPASENREPS